MGPPLGHRRDGVKGLFAPFFGPEIAPAGMQTTYRQSTFGFPALSVKQRPSLAPVRCSMRTLSIAFACTLLFAASTALADSRVFIVANHGDGYGVDQCLARGDKCGAHAARSDRGAERVRVVARVGDERLASRMCEELIGHDHLVSLPRRDREVDGSAFRVDDGVELR